MSGASKMLWAKLGPEIKNMGKILELIDSSHKSQVDVDVLNSKQNKKKRI
jgi:hypothetical protein